MSYTLEYLNHHLPYQKPAAIRRQAEILGVDAEPGKIVEKVLDTHLKDVLVCIESGRDVPLLKGDPNALVTVMPLLNPNYWATSLVFPLSGPRSTVLRQLKNLKVSKKS